MHRAAGQGTETERGNRGRERGSSRWRGQGLIEELLDQVEAPVRVLDGDEFGSVQQNNPGGISGREVLRSGGHQQPQARVRGAKSPHPGGIPRRLVGGEAGRQGSGLAGAASNASSGAPCHLPADRSGGIRVVRAFRVSEM